jgi:hypothetical protein
MRRLRRCMPALACAAALAAAPSASADKLGGVEPPVSGVARTTESPILKNQPGPTVRGKRGVLIRGKAYAPSRAPYAVKRVIWAANQIRHTPYKWGGGHGSWSDSGYDCSGAVSYALHGGGLLSYPMASGPLMRWGTRGSGKWITVYANRTHAFMVVAGMRFDTSGWGERGPRWRAESRSTSGFARRHPPGL